MVWQSAMMLVPTLGVKAVAKIDVRLCVEDMTGSVNITDIMFQGGVLATLWSGHPAEIRFSFEQGPQ